MKKRANNVVLGIGVVLLLGWCGMSLAASPPERINFQGVLRDAAGAPAADGDYSMVFRFFGNGAGACDCGRANGTPGCTDASCESEVCGIDSFCCGAIWDITCAFEAEQFRSCQVCIADEFVLQDAHESRFAVPVSGGLFNVALGAGVMFDGPGPGFYTSLGQLFRDFDVVYVETVVNGELLSPRIRVEGSAYTQNALQLEGKRAAEFLDTSATTQVKAGDLEVQGDVTVGGNVAFSDGSVLMSARPDPPCFDNANRFVDCGNGTVTDTATGLIWLQDASCNSLPGLGGDARGNYQEANEAAASLQDGDCSLTDNSSPGDWRLPTKSEWEDMIREADLLSCSPTISDTTGTGCWSEGDPFAGVQSDLHWSSSTNASFPFVAGGAALGSGTIINDGKIISVYVAWPVRGGPEAVGGDTFVVTSDPIPVAPGALQVFGSAECPVGSRVTGGGYSFAMFIDTPHDPSQIWVKRSRPQGSSWEVEVWNIDNVDPQPPFTVYAVCLPR